MASSRSMVFALVSGALVVACADEPPRDERWGDAALIEDEPGNAGIGGLATRGADDAIVVWQQWDGAFHSTWANRYTAASGWETAGPIEDIDAQAESQAVAMDGAGNAIATWKQGEGGDAAYIWSNRYTVGEGWGVASRLIDIPDVTAFDVRPVVSRSGAAIVVFPVPTAPYVTHYWAVRFDPVTGVWSAPEQLETTEQRLKDRPVAAIDDAGNAIVAWTSAGDGDFPTQMVWRSQFVVGEGWSEATSVGELDEDLELGALAMRPDGEAFLVWHPRNTEAQFVARYEPGTGWRTPDVIATPDPGYHVELGFTDGGGAVMVWTSGAGSYSRVSSSLYAPTLGWTRELPIDACDGGPRDCSLGDSLHHLAVAPDGRAVVTWMQYPGVWAAHLDADGVWSEGRVMIDEEVPAAEVGFVDGKALAVWRDSNSVWAAVER